MLEADRFIQLCHGSFIDDPAVSPPEQEPVINAPGKQSKEQKIPGMGSIECKSIPALLRSLFVPSEEIEHRQQTRHKGESQAHDPLDA